MSEALSKEVLDDSLMHFLHLHKETMRRFFQNCGLFNGHPHALFFLRRTPGLTQRELAKKLNIAAATVAVSVRRMEMAGLVRRERDEQDGRVMHLYLTEWGCEIDDRCRKGKDFLIQTLYRNMTEEEQQTLYALLQKMTLNLEEAFRAFPAAEPAEEDEPKGGI